MTANLASHPFRNRTVPWTLAIVVAVLSVLALAAIAKSTIQTNAQTEAAASDVARLRKQVEDRNGKAKAIETALSTEQKRDLKSAHTLVDRKRFSWSLLLADLEEALPGDVRVTRIAVKEVRVQDGRTVANLDLVVGSQDPKNVTQMIEDMTREGVFQPVLLAQNPQRGKGEGGAEYEMDVFYVPRAGAPAEPGDKNKRPVDTASRKVEPQ